MGEALTEIPTIDLDDFEAGGVRRDEFTDLTMRALHDIGFAFVKIPADLPEKLACMYKVCERLFDLPEEVKNEYEDADIHHERGYTPLNSETGIQCRAVGFNKEGMPNYAENWFIGPEMASNHPMRQKYPSLYTPNIWPKETPELKDAVFPVYDSLYRMGKLVLSTLEPALGKDSGYFESLLKDSPTLLRPLHYPAVSEEEAPHKIGACNHTDIDLLTVLPAPTREGLIIKTREGRKISGMAPPGHLIVQVGDQLQYMTGNHFLSAQHEVVSPVAQNAGDKGRYSSALFIQVGAAPLEVIPGLTDRPQDFPTVIGADFIVKRLKDIGLGK